MSSLHFSVSFVQRDPFTASVATQVQASWSGGVSY